MTARVLVVGAGPVGLTAALEFTRYGIPVRIVDQAPARSDTSKALAIWSRTLELMDRCGLGATFVAAGHPCGGMRLMSGAKQLGHLSLDGIASPYPFALLIPQNETERVLEECLVELGVRVERGVELTQFSASPDRVTATLKRAGGTSESLDVEWLVACDGAHSPVRHALGKTFAGTTVPTDFVLADVHLAGADLPASEISIFAHADGLLALFPIRADRFRVIADIGAAAGGARADPTLEEVQTIVSRRGPAGIRAFDPIWLSPFRVNERQVDDYRAGRVFLAGDAAHVHSPAGGQGMNTGMQDACNLAWKIALVARGTCAAEPLLASYNAERHPVAERVIAESGRLAAIMTVRGGALQFVRNALASVLFGRAPLRDAFAATLSEISIGYPHSPLTHGAARPPGGPGAGERAPLRAGEPPVGAGPAPRFALFAAAGDGADGLTTQFSEMVEPGLRTPFHPGGLWLVRPDGYVGLATAATDRPAAAAYLDALVRGSA